MSQKGEAAEGNPGKPTMQCCILPKLRRIIELESAVLSSVRSLSSCSYCRL